jgi:hypothetical protein
MKSLLLFIATIHVVQLPMNGSRTIPSSGHQALIQGSISSKGNVAK